MDEDPGGSDGSRAAEHGEATGSSKGREPAGSGSRIFGNIHTDFTKNATFYTNHHWLFTPGPGAAPAAPQLSAGSGSVLSFLLPRICSSNNSLSLGTEIQMF